MPRGKPSQASEPEAGAWLFDDTMFQLVPHDKNQFDKTQIPVALKALGTSSGKHSQRSPHPDSIRLRRTNIAIVDKLNNSDNLMVSNLSTFDDQLGNTVKHTVSSPQFLDSLQQSLVFGPFIGELCKQITSSPVFVDLITSMVSDTLKQQQEEICRLQKTADDF
ncbi:unnamed protein product [Didymodactylos carnosus]|uniref:Uncharacterized protein n=1 Tax=Didymodactylos carnosus TaxID=1234261 RepID=A0A8S2L4J8_9BILA|nr:unnamed protein product [Didymodactylos carnosus]CAF3884406.1 unnamed protein product [Didymodactylos carnosus]